LLAWEPFGLGNVKFNLLSLSQGFKPLPLKRLHSTLGDYDLFGKLAL